MPKKRFGKRAAYYQNQFGVTEKNRLRRFLKYKRENPNDLIAQSIECPNNHKKRFNKKA